MCCCMFSVLCLMVWLLNSLVCLSMLCRVSSIFFRFIGGGSFIVVCLGMKVCVIVVLWFWWGSVLMFLVVCLKCLYFCSWCISLVCGLVLLFFLLIGCGSSICDFILVRIVVIIRYLVVSLKCSLCIMVMYFMYCWVILVMGMFSIFRFWWWIRYSSRFSGFLKVFRMIFSVFGGMYRFCGICRIGCLCIMVSGIFCCWGVGG